MAATAVKTKRRNVRPLEIIATAFDGLPHTVQMRFAEIVAQASARAKFSVITADGCLKAVQTASGCEEESTSDLDTLRPCMTAIRALMMAMQPVD